MKQVFQSLSSGEISLEDMPIPSIEKGQVLIKTSLSLISSGTERFLIDFGKSNLMQKALKQPERVKEVIDKARTDGIYTTLKRVQNKLDEPLPLGYCNVGEIIGVGEEVKNLEIGQRVVSNGYHAEFIAVNENLCTPIPDDIKDHQGVFTILASIGLQGIRLINPSLGENILVSGLGIIGILSAQLLRFNGCKVFAIDPDKRKCELAERLGIKSCQITDKSKIEKWCLDNTDQVGMDAVLITATTKSSDPIDLAAKVSRVRGKIILVGVTGIAIKRDLFYKKELQFQVSCSYGPGRYDPNYEEYGQDYPIGFVRWTENRNFQAVLHALSSKMIQTEDLISKTYDIENATLAYQYLLEENSSLGIILKYPKKPLIKNTQQKKIQINSGVKADINKGNTISFIGAGNYAKSILVPAFYKAGGDLNLIASKSGMGAAFLGKKFRFKKATTNYREILKDKETNAIVIATRHNSHAKYIIDSLKSGKHVFVEKPICLNLAELEEIHKCLEENAKSRNCILMVGFNRRFAPLIKILKKNLENIYEPKAYNYTCNAGFIGKDHWTQNPKIGGGRLLGEACHFVDLLRFLENSPIVKLETTKISESKKYNDSFSIQIKFKNGSIGTIHYLSNGNKKYPKERLEVFTEQKIFNLDNYRKLQVWGSENFRTKKIFFQDKGQNNCAKAFLNSIKDGSNPPIPYDQIFEVQRKLIDSITK